MTGSDPPPSFGHNGRPPLEEPVRHARGRCRECRHWRAPSDDELRAYEWFRLGLSHRRVRRPAGACDRVVLSPGRPPEPKPAGGYVTIWESGRVVWQGSEEAIPARFLQADFDL